MNALVVGGNSFIGAALVRRLVAEQWRVSVLSLDPPPADVARRLAWIQVDRNDHRALAAHLAGRGFDVVFDNIAYEAQQVTGLLDAVEAVGRYVLTSSVDVYGHQYPRLVTESRASLEPFETAGFEGNERYLRGKRACERVLQSSAVPWSIVRPAMVVGLHDNITSSDPRLLTHAEARRRARSLHLPCRVQDGGPILLRQDDQAVFRLVWADDLVRALLCVAQHPEAAGRSFNAAGDECFTTESFARTLASVARREIELVKVPPHVLARAGLGDLDPPWGRGPYWSTADNAPLKSLGWLPSPARLWMTRLVETPVPPEARPGWDGRPRERALAAHLLRRLPPQKQPALVATPRSLPTSPAATPGRATSIGTRAWAVARGLPESHFRIVDGIWRSSVGVGTWMGAPDAATDALYREAIGRAIIGGLNVIDTAINYRHMRSERVIGEVLRAGVVPREALVVSTKGGFVTHDADDPRPPELCIHDRWVRPGLLPEDDARRGHSLSPGFIEAQLDLSLENLGLACVDVYFLHNPELAKAHSPARFWHDLEATVERLESAAQEGRIGAWGLATWDGLRVDEREARHLPLERMLRLARRVGGERHHLRVVQLPFSAWRPEALTRPTQRVGHALLPALAALSELGLIAYTSASVGQGRLHESPELPLPSGLEPGAAALQLARSAPGVTTALVGLRRRAHVEQALALAQEEVSAWTLATG